MSVRGLHGKGFHRKVFYPLVLRFRSEQSTFERLGELRSREREPEPDLQRRQARLLATLLPYAGARCPYYRDRWNIPASVEAENALAILRELPILDRRELQRNPDALRASPGPRRITRKTTGGSTGEPVTVWKDAEAVAQERAASWLAHGWFGVEIGDRGARFWGSPRGMGSRRLRFAAADLAMRRIRFSAFAFDDGDLERYWKQCLRSRPRYFYGYVSMLTAFADFMERRGYDGRELGLKVIITTAEALTSPQRERLRAVFGAPVQNEYGCGELGLIACECEAGALHVMSQNVLVELLLEDGQEAATGEVGKVVVTDLHNRAMPLVRYALGDLAVRGDACSCGRGFSVLRKVRGREYEFVQDRDGRRFHGEFFMYLFEDLRDQGLGVERFQVRQTSESRIDVEVQAPSPLSERQVDYIIDYVANGTSGLNAEVTRLPSIGPAPSGKSRVIVNDWLAKAGNASRT